MGERVIVVGGGAAGLMAAGRAAEMGAEVLLTEKTAGPGNKLRLTGNRRCNLTNAQDLSEFIAHLGPNGPFMRNAFARFFAPELRRFLAVWGVPTVAQPDGRVFPASSDASQVVQALVRCGSSHGVAFHYNTPVAEILAAEGAVQGVRLRDGSVLSARGVILATGGLSYPQTGSSGDGYPMAERLGHTITPLRPGLVPLLVAERFAPRLQGVALPHVQATLAHDGHAVANAQGELLFTHYGVSGPAILTLSLHLAHSRRGLPLRLMLDLKPEHSEEELRQHLRTLARSGRASYHTLLKGLLPRALAAVIGELSGIPAAARQSQLTTEQIARTARWLKNLELTVTGTRPLREAMITVGGVSVNEIEPQTMASRLVRGLYFAGEIMDVAGETGGYNLQVAFTTGYLAGEAAAKQALDQPDPMRE